MLETLYRTQSPETSRLDGECFELILCSEDGAYFVREIHGWWDAEENRFIHSQVTLSPEEGHSTFEKAHERYIQQRIARAKSGFIHSFSPHYYGKRAYEYERINCLNEAT
ncbi:MAG: hypothetical protein WCE63_21910 [Acidobacteriaceae bacterium]